MARSRDVARLARAVAAFCHAEEPALRRMVALNSFTENARGVNDLAQLTADWFAARVDPRFAAVAQPSRHAQYGSHVAIIQQQQPQSPPRPVVGLVSHLDTVYPAAVERRLGFGWDAGCGGGGGGGGGGEGGTRDAQGSWVVGPGTMDIKGGTFMVGAVLHALRRARPDVFARADFRVLLNASEEVMADDFVGFCQRALSAAPFDSATPAGGEERTATAAVNVAATATPAPTGADAAAPPCLGCLVFEAGAFRQSAATDNGGAADRAAPHALQHAYKLVTSRKGMCVWTVRFSGQAAHAGNAHAAGASAIAAACALALRLEALTDYGNDVTFNVGRLEGGTTHNTVPDSAELLVEMRARDAECFAHAQRQFADAVAATEAAYDNADAQRGGAVALAVHPQTAVDPWCPNAATEQLFRHWEAAAAALAEGWPADDEVWPNPFHHRHRHDGGGGGSGGGGDTVAVADANGGGDDDDDAFVDGGGVGCARPATVVVREEARGGLSDGNWLWSSYPTLDGLGPHGEFAHVPARERLHTTSFVPKAVLNCLGILALLDAHDDSRYGSNDHSDDAATR